MISETWVTLYVVPGRDGKISWSDRVQNVVLHRVKRGRRFINKIK
jgi:hypothetical protein